MATNLDLQEQEQLDALKSFWKRWGNLVTAVLFVVLAAYAGWGGWNWYQRDQGAKAGAMFDELDRAAAAGDAERAGRVLADLQQRFPSTEFAVQGALLAARVQFDQGQADAARASLAWVLDKAGSGEMVTVAALRLAGLQLEAGQPDEALRTLERAKAEGFEALVADRRGDVLLAQGQTDAARQAYQQAWAAMPATLDYRQIVEAKLTALAAPPGAVAASLAASAPGAGAAPAANAAAGAAPAGARP
jgi:predicted negative regulator of RcsB-dependent stress response